MPNLCEAGAGGQSDIPRADYRNPHGFAVEGLFVETVDAAVLVLDVADSALFVDGLLETVGVPAAEAVVTGGVNSGCFNSK